LSLISKNVRTFAERKFSELGLDITFGRSANELDEFSSSSIESRVNDLHSAFLDKSIKGIIAAVGGYNSNQLLRYLDWNLIKNNPKLFVGFSDTSALQNAIYAKTGLVTYSGPTYSTFGQMLGSEYTLEYFKKCVIDDGEFDVFPSELWSDCGWHADQRKLEEHKNDGWLPINMGSAEGTILGANICTFNLLQGTEYFPNLTNSILFLEDDGESKIFHFDRDLQSLLHLPEFKKVGGIIIGRFQKASDIKADDLIKSIKEKRELSDIPVLAGVDFGHTDPMITFPIGGRAKFVVGSEKSSLKIIKH
tara:strand:- start:657 stop:1574 length:918 start_codon:yes stop_codon:yes gene_type:complete